MHRCCFWSSVITHTDVLVHAWAQTTKCWGHSDFSFPPKHRGARGIMRKNDDVLFCCFSSAAAANMTSNKQLANDVYRFGPPPPSPADEKIESKLISHTRWNICSTKRQNLCVGVVALYVFMVCDVHSTHEGDKPAPRPLQASSWNSDYPQLFSEAFTRRSRRSALPRTSNTHRRGCLNVLNVIPLITRGWKDAHAGEERTREEHT